MSVTIQIPSPGGVDAVFTPSPDCTMLYTEQLSWFLLHYYKLCSDAGVEVTNWQHSQSETASPASIRERLEQLDYLEQIKDALSAMQVEVGTIDTSIALLPTAIGNIEWVLSQINNIVNTYPDYLDRFVRFTRDFAGIDEDYDGNPKDGLTDLISFVNNDITSISTWIGEALQASEDDIAIPDLPVLAIIAKFVPAKYALLVKLGIDIVGKLLMSYLKGRLEHPNAKIGDIEPLVDLLRVAFLDQQEESFFAPSQLTEDWSVSFGESGSPRFTFFPRWNAIDSITSE